MKYPFILTTIMLVLSVLSFPTPTLSGESGQCYFQAFKDVYLTIYNLDEDGVERGTAWSGHLAEGGTKSFTAPYGEVGYATREHKDDPWEGSHTECVNGEAIPIP